VKLVLEYRLNEFRATVAAIAKGLHCIVPKRLLALFTWDQVWKIVKTIFGTCKKKKGNNQFGL
jgi:hypothetical protein